MKKSKYVSKMAAMLGRRKKDVVEIPSEIKSESSRRNLVIACNQKEFIFDQVRALAISKGIPQPHHGNAWGAICRIAATKGWIKKTNRCKPSTLVSNHGHMQTIWESNL